MRRILRRGRFCEEEKVLKGDALLSKKEKKQGCSRAFPAIFEIPCWPVLISHLSSYSVLGT